MEMIITTVQVNIGLIIAILIARSCYEYVAERKRKPSCMEIQKETVIRNTILSSINDYLYAVRIQITLLVVGICICMFLMNI